MAEYAPAAITHLFDLIHAGIPAAINAGIVGDSDHDYGYHRGRDYVPPGDYSAQLDPDQQGDGQAADALDLSWTVAGPQFDVSARLLAAAGDPRMAPVREFYGSTDGVTVCGWDYPGGYPVTSDDSHLWHVHLSVLRAYYDDPAALAAVADVITGATTTGDHDMSQADIDFMKDQLVEIRRLTGATMNPRGDGEYAIPDQVTMRSRVAVRPYAGNPPDTYTVETVLSELLDLARAIRDAVTPLDPGR